MGPRAGQPAPSSSRWRIESDRAEASATPRKQQLPLRSIMGSGFGPRVRRHWRQLISACAELTPKSERSSPWKLGCQWVFPARVWLWGYWNTSKVWVPGGGQTFGVSRIVTLLKHIASEGWLRGGHLKFTHFPLILSSRFLKLSM